jgi:hypothetical protein
LRPCSGASEASYRIALGGDDRFDAPVAIKLFARRPHLGANFIERIIEATLCGLVVERGDSRDCRALDVLGKSFAQPLLIVNRVPRIEWPAIGTHIRKISAQLDEPLRAVVARLAQRLELAEPEPIDVSAMRLDVVDDRSCRHDTALKAERAQRLDAQLMAP